MGMNSPFDYCGNNGGPLVDKMIGTAYTIVKKVADEIENLRYIVYNMSSILSVANRFDQYQNLTVTDPVVETLTVPTLNTLSALSKTYSGKTAIIFVDGKAYVSGFTITGTAIVWDPVATGAVLTSGVSKVAIFYSPIPG